MGPFDNTIGEYCYSDDINNAHWFIHHKTGQLIIIAREDDEFESYGDDGIIQPLLNYLDSELEDSELMERLGFDILSPFLRRFNTQIGFYSA